jgi:hypothetical protein
LHLVIVHRNNRATDHLTTCWRGGTPHLLAAATMRGPPLVGLLVRAVRIPHRILAKWRQARNRLDAVYRGFGCSGLTEGDWEELRIENGELRIENCRFFRVKVEMR